MYGTNLSAISKCRVIDLQVTSKRGAPQSPHGKRLQIGETRVWGDVFGQSDMLFAALVGRRELPLTKKGKESRSLETDWEFSTGPYLETASVLGQLLERDTKDMSIAGACGRLRPLAGRATFSFRIAFRGCQPGRSRSHCIMCRS